VSDLPLLDAARLRLGDPETSRRKRRQEAAGAANVNSEPGLSTICWRRLRHRAVAAAGDRVARRRDDDAAWGGSARRLIDETALPSIAPDLLAGPFAHIVVDEAQELTDAEWQMLLLRCPSRSFTIVGDRAQARHGFTESWPERLERIGLDRAMWRP